MFFQYLHGYLGHKLLWSDSHHVGSVGDVKYIKTSMNSNPGFSHTFSTIKSNIQHICCSSPLRSRESHLQMTTTSLVSGKNHAIFGLFGAYRSWCDFWWLPKTQPKKRRPWKNSMIKTLLEGDAFLKKYPEISAEDGNSGFAIIPWNNPKKLEKPWITKGQHLAIFRVDSIM